MFFIARLDPLGPYGAESEAELKFLETDDEDTEHDTTHCMRCHTEEPDDTYAEFMPAVWFVPPSGTAGFEPGCDDLVGEPTEPLVR